MSVSAFSEVFSWSWPAVTVSHQDPSAVPVSECLLFCVPYLVTISWKFRIRKRLKPEQDPMHLQCIFVNYTERERERERERKEKREPVSSTGEKKRPKYPPSTLPQNPSSWCFQWRQIRKINLGFALDLFKLLSNWKKKKQLSYFSQRSAVAERLFERSGELPSVRDERRVRGEKRENSSCTSIDSTWTWTLSLRDLGQGQLGVATKPRLHDCTCTVEDLYGALKENGSGHARSSSP